MLLIKPNIVWGLSDEKPMRFKIYLLGATCRAPVSPAAGGCLSLKDGSINVLAPWPRDLWCGGHSTRSRHMNLGGCGAGRGWCLAQRLVSLAMLGLLLLSGCAGGPRVVPAELQSTI